MRHVKGKAWGRTGTCAKLPNHKQFEESLQTTGWHIEGWEPKDIDGHSSERVIARYLLSLQDISGQHQWISGLQDFF